MKLPELMHGIKTKSLPHMVVFVGTEYAIINEYLDQMEKLYESLESHGIEVIDDEPAADGEVKNRLALRGEPLDDGLRARKIDAFVVAHEVAASEDALPAVDRRADPVRDDVAHFGVVPLVVVVNAFGLCGLNDRA